MRVAQALTMLLLAARGLKEKRGDRPDRDPADETTARQNDARGGTRRRRAGTIEHASGVKRSTQGPERAAKVGGHTGLYSVEDAILG